MINANIAREAENASRNQNVNKETPSDRRIFRMKANALSDVQNTLHSRPGQFTNLTNSGVKAPNKPSVHSTGSENALSTKKIKCGKNPKSAAFTSWKDPIPTFQSDHLEYHNHILCEQAELSSVSDFLYSYKLSDSQISALTRSVKNGAAHVTYKVNEPCEDIEIPFRKSEDPFSISDIFNDILPMKIDAPSW